MLSPKNLLMSAHLPRTEFLPVRSCVKCLEETGAQRGTGPKPYCESDRVRIRIARAPHQPLQPSAPKTPVTDSKTGGKLAK